MKICEKIKELRKDKNKTQQAVSDALNLPRYTIANWEQGRAEPSIEDLVNLANFFEISIDYLVGRADDFGVVTIAPNSAELSADEKEVIRRYRSLSPFQQEAIRMQLDAMTENAKQL